MAEGAVAVLGYIGSALQAGAGAVGVGGGAGAVGGGTVGVATGAGTAGVGAAGSLGSAVLAGGVPTAGLTTLEIAQLGLTAASLGTTANSLLEKAPKPDAPPSPPSRDTAREEADRMSALYRKRGRAAALLTEGGAAGDVSSPNLGSASLLGT